MTVTSSQPSSPQVSRICFVAWLSSGTVAYSQMVMPPQYPRGSGSDPVELPTGGEVLRPVGDVRVLAQEGATLTLRQTTPHTELDLVVEGVGATLGDDRAVAADDGGLALLCAADEEGVRITGAALGLGDPLATL